MNKKKMFNQALICFLVLVITLITPQKAFSLPASTIMFVDPASSTATTCGTQTIAIRVENVQDLTGYHLEITFDPAVIEVTNVVNGGFLAPPGEDALYDPTNEIDNVNGLIRFGMVQQGDGGGDPDPKSGDGVLIEITLQAVVPNQTSLIEIDTVESILVDWPDANEIEYTSVDGSVNTESCAPTKIVLTHYHLAENEPVGTEIGNFLTIDPDNPDDSFIYEFVSGEGDDDNTSFEINGSTLFSGRVFDYEEKNAHNIRVRSTDKGGKTIEKTFTVFITDVNEVPVAHDQTVYTAEEEPVEITLTGFDVDGDELVFELISAPGHGVLSGTVPDLTFTPDDNYLGSDSFTFRVFDGQLYSEPATVSIIIDEKKGVDYYYPVFMHMYW